MVTTSKLRLLLFILFFSALTGLPSAFAQEMSPAAHLRRASLILRGIPPSPQDYAALANAEDVKLKAEELMVGYVLDTQFARRMHFRLRGLFRLADGSYIVGNKDQKEFDESGFESNNSLDQLLYRLILENRSWDELLTAKVYRFKPSPLLDSRKDDLSFFRAVFEQELDPKISVDPLIQPSKVFALDGQLDPKKSQVLAGALTTGRFFNRYQTTKLNQNLGRAAAVLRIFLCEDLQLVILPNVKEDRNLLTLALTGRKSAEDAHSAAASAPSANEKRHAQDPQCQSCHYKLEPIARTFRGSALILNPQPARGGLVFTRADGSLLNEEVIGLGQLGEAIVRQPEYAACQVKHFWNWFIGKDVYLPPERLQKLVQVFDDVGRRPRDFARHLVNAPEFFTPPNANHIVTYGYVAPIFNACNQCHQKINDAPLLDLYPFGIGRDGNRMALEFIGRTVDWNHDGKKASMPPKNAGWQLSPKQMEMLQLWVSQGARNDKGEPQLSPQEVAALLSADKRPQRKKAEPTFDDTFRRYLGGYDLVRSVELFSATQPSAFLQIRDDERTSGGVRNHITGEQHVLHPNSAYAAKVEKLLPSAIPNLKVRVFNQFFAEAKNSGGISLLTAWKAIGIQQQQSIIDIAINLVVGPSVLGKAKQSLVRDNLMKQLKKQSDQDPSLSLDMSLSHTLHALLTSEYFLTY